MTRQPPTSNPAEQATTGLPISPPEPALFRHTATAGILQILLNDPYDRFTIRGVAGRTSGSHRIDRDNCRRRDRNRAGGHQDAIADELGANETLDTLENELLEIH